MAGKNITPNFSLGYDSEKYPTTDNIAPD